MSAPTRPNRQPSIPGGLVKAAQAALAATGLPHQQAAVWVHAGALVQHAVQVGLVSDGLGLRETLDEVAALHPGLVRLAELPVLSAGAETAITSLWKNHTLIQSDGNTEWYAYPLGDLYQTLSVESVKGRALCQTPWWVGELLLHVSYDRAQEEWMRPQVIDPSCGTGHLLVESFRRARSDHRFYDGYSPINPYRHYTPSLEQALAAVHGVDLDPYAATIATYRLLVLAWAQLQHRGGVSALAGLPVNVACADSLLADDEPLLERGRYHVVVANPPYIVPKDKAQNDAIRKRYPAVAHMKYSLALPFHALMNELLVPGGWCAQLTANSFMKREFGRPYIEQYLTQYQLEWIIDTSGAYIPGHGTPTLILVNRNQAPTSETVHTVLGIQGEPKQPADPSQALVWSAIRDAVETRESAMRFGRGAEIAARLSQPALEQEPAPVVPMPRRETPKPVQGTLFDLMEAAA